MRSSGQLSQEVSLSSSCHLLHLLSLTFISPTSSLIMQSVRFSSALIGPRRPPSVVHRVCASSDAKRVNSDSSHLNLIQVNSNHSLDKNHATFGLLNVSLVCIGALRLRLIRSSQQQDIGLWLKD